MSTKLLDACNGPWDIDGVRYGDASNTLRKCAGLLLSMVVPPGWPSPDPQNVAAAKTIMDIADAIEQAMANG